jgi:glucokinase
VSTGIGGALFIDGDLYDGATGSAGEVGHTPISDNGPACGQGHPGCLEGMSSGTAIAARARAELAAGTASSLQGVDPASIDARAIATAANAGDAISLQVFDDAGHALGRAIGGFINVLAPDVIVIGGGLIHAGDLLLRPARLAVTQIAFEIPYRRCKIVTAALGTDAGLIGAVAWAVRSFGGAPVGMR